MVPSLLRGDEVWCQGFSEPGSGSNLAVAHLPRRARRRRVAGDRAEGVDQPVAVRAALRAADADRDGRVGAQGDHRAVRRHGLARDHRPPDRDDGRRAGVLARCSSTTCSCPFERTLGDEGQGWAFAMDLLPYERSTALWQRAAWLHRRLRDLVETAGPGALRRRPPWARSPSSCTRSGPARAPRSTGWPPARRSARRRRSTRCCWRRPSRRCSTSPLTRSRPTIALGDDVTSERWRSEFLYSRAATIYGGSAEIQRNIIARRLLELGDDR